MPRAYWEFTRSQATTRLETYLGDDLYFHRSLCCLSNNSSILFLLVFQHFIKLWQNAVKVVQKFSDKNIGNYSGLKKVEVFGKELKNQVMCVGSKYRKRVETVEPRESE